MIKVNIANASGIFATKNFETQSLADLYIQEMKDSEHWGKSDKDFILTPEVKDEQGNVISPAVMGHQNAEIFFTTEDITAQFNLEQRIESLATSGESDELVCKKCLHVIGGYNKEKSLTTAQIQSMATTFASVDFCLEKFMPKSAKSLISSISPDGFIVTQELKDLLLEVLKEY